MTDLVSLSPIIAFLTRLLFISLLCFFCALIFSIFYRLVRSKFKKNRPRTQRTEPPKIIKWTAKSRHADYLDQCKSKGLLYLGFDIDDYSAVYLDRKDLVRHIHTIGGTGSGKTTGVCQPVEKQLIDFGFGMVIVDDKGDIEGAKTVYKFCQDAGREDDFLLFATGMPEKSSTYNPLLIGNSTQLKDKIVGSIQWSEIHYKRECENALQILFDEYFSYHKTITLQILNDILINPPPYMKRFRQFFSQHKKNILGIQDEISLLINNPFGHLFNGDEINLMEAYQNKKVIYFSINLAVYQETGRRLGRLITGDLNALNGILQSQSYRQPFFILIDEFQEFSTLEFATTLAQGRSVEFMILIAHQSIGDLRAISDYYPQKVMTNTNTRLILPTTDPEIAQMVADEIGTEAIIKQTKQVDNETYTGLGSVRDKEQYIIHPQRVKNLKIGYAVYILPSGRSGVVMLNPIFPDLKGISLPEPPRERIIKTSEKPKPTQEPRDDLL